VDAGNLEKKELSDKIVYFVERGADIIDLGISLETSKADVSTAVETQDPLRIFP